MPFMGKDWRSPGEAWVKTESLGWQRMKIIESQLHPSCHQDSACSWPPKSDFGRHMAANSSALGRQSSNSKDPQDSSSNRSSDGSRGGSASPSPTSSPDRNFHHIHPIVIASPYGQYSCCANHLESRSSSTSPVSRPNSNKDKVPGSGHLLDAQTITRSLSKKFSRATDGSSPLLRHNNSFSDFRQPRDFSNSSNQGILRETSINPRQQNEWSNQTYQTDKLDCLGASTKDGHVGGKFMTCGENDPQANENKPNRSDCNQSCCCCNSNQSQFRPKEPLSKTAPHCRISVRTREVAMYNTISEAFYKLDFCNAIHDIRRFNYICKLLHLLITQNLTSLSGCATKILFTMLEQVAWEVSSSKRDIHVLRNLLNELKYMIRNYYCWGRPIGSSLLWQQHFDTIDRISQMVDEIELSPPKKDGSQPKFDDLPCEMIHEILLRLKDYRDLINSAQASPVMRTMIDGQYIWRQLCNYHFTEQQLKWALDNYKASSMKRSNIKYARTASANGRTSFRSPVPHKPPGKSTTKQIEQKKERRNSHKEETVIGEQPSSSHVTRVIRIFDNEMPSCARGSSRPTPSQSRLVTRDAEAGHKNAQQAKGSPLNDAKQAGQENCPSNHDQPVHKVDWEHVFHYLRKKYDLKEEYTDSLLLCRHCRCLFWKHFGHPCFVGDDTSTDPENSKYIPISPQAFLKFFSL